jgi:D-3-phosphoglycerate dehydrogenase
VVVSRYGVGTDNIPVARATELGIVVANVPDYCVEEVSDHVMGQLLACARRLVEYANDTAAGNWRQEGAASLPRLRGQTLGLVGAGLIARALVRRRSASGCASSPTRRASVRERSGRTSRRPPTFAGCSPSPTTSPSTHQPPRRPTP